MSKTQGINASVIDDIQADCSKINKPDAKEACGQLVDVLSTYMTDSSSGRSLESGQANLRSLVPKLNALLDKESTPKSLWQLSSGAKGGSGINDLPKSWISPLVDGRFQWQPMRGKRLCL